MTAQFFAFKKDEKPRSPLLTGTQPGSAWFLFLRKSSTSKCVRSGYLIQMAAWVASKGSSGLRDSQTNSAAVANMTEKRINAGVYESPATS